MAMETTENNTMFPELVSLGLSNLHVSSAPDKIYKIKTAGDTELHYVYATRIHVQMTECNRKDVTIHVQ